MHNPGLSTRIRLVEIVLMILIAAIFATSKVHDMHDAQYSMFLSETLLRRGTFEIAPQSIPRLRPFAHPGIVGNGYPYQLEVVNGKLMYGYPLGSSILSLPFVALMNGVGVSTLTADGKYNEANEKFIEAALAALLMAALTVIFLRTALILLPLSWSIVLSLGGALSTQVWSTASRALWSHTWQIFILGVVAYLLLSEEESETRMGPVILATLAAWAYFVRPTSSIPIAAISVYVALYRRDRFIAYAITGTMWATAFLAFSRIVYGRPIPGYYVPLLTPAHFWKALAADLVSPSRGLFVFVPGAAFVLFLIAYYWRTLPCWRLALLSLSIIVTHLVVISLNPGWWGGHSYGARLVTDILPWFFLLAVLGCRCLLDEPSSALKRSLVVVGLLTIFVGALMNGHGARSRQANDWVNQPSDIDQQPDRVWDWSNPQFLAAIYSAKQNALQHQ